MSEKTTINSANVVHIQPNNAEPSQHTQTSPATEAISENTNELKRSNSLALIREVGRKDETADHSALDRADIGIQDREQKDDFPITCLPNSLKRAIIELHQTTGAALGTAAQQVLAMISYAVSDKCDVRYPNSNRAMPTSAYFFTAVETGEAKSSVTDLIQARVKAEAQRRNSQENIEQAAWRRSKHAVMERLAQEKLELSTSEYADLERDLLDKLGPQPRLSFARFKEGTIEGLLNALCEDSPAVLFENTEAGIVFGNKAFKEDRTRFCSVLSAIYSREDYQRRLKSETIIVSNKALTMSLMGQPAVVTEILKDEEMRQQGFWPRVNLCIPPRIRKSYQVKGQHQSRPHLQAFTERLCELVFMKPYTTGETFDLDLPIIEMTEIALDIAIELINETVDDLNDPEVPSYLKDFLKRRIENATRIAAAIAFYESAEPEYLQTQNAQGEMVIVEPRVVTGIKCPPIDRYQLEAAILIVDHSIKQWEALLSDTMASDLSKDAATVYEKMLRAQTSELDKEDPRKSIVEGRFTIAAVKRCRCDYGLSGARGGTDAATAYLQGKVLPYLIERGKLAPRKERGSPVWQLNYNEHHLAA